MAWALSRGQEWTIVHGSQRQSAFKQNEKNISRARRGSPASLTRDKRGKDGYCVLLSGKLYQAQVAVAAELEITELGRGLVPGKVVLTACRCRRAGRFVGGWRCRPSHRERSKCRCACRGRSE